MTASDTTFGPSYPAPLGVSYTSIGVDPSAGPVIFTYTIDNPTGYAALGWGQGLPDIEMQGNSFATLTFSALSNSNLTAAWTGSVNINATGPNAYSGPLNVELVATIQSGSTGWVQDTYSSQTGAPAYIALLDGSGSFSVSLEYLVQIPGTGTWTSLAGFFNSDAYGGGAGYRTDTDGEFAGSLLPMTVASFQTNQASIDASGATVAISDIAANIGGSNLDTLNDYAITSITVSDNNLVDASVLQLTTDNQAIGELINNDGSPAQLDIKDSAADIQSNISTLSLNLAVIGQIDVTSGTVTTDATTALSAGAAPVFAKIVGGVTIFDSAADIEMNIDALNSDTHIASISLTDSGTPALTLDTLQALGDTKTLGEISGPYTITISDSAISVSTSLDALNADAHVTSIMLTDSGTPVLNLSVAQALDDTTALGEISGPYTIAISDTAAHVAANIDAINSDAHVTSIVLMGGGTPSLTLSATQALDDTTALGEIAGMYTIAIADSAADVAQDIDALNSDASVTSIALTDAGTPALTLNATQALNDTTALGEISTPYTITISDTAAQVAAYIDALDADTHVTSIALTDGGTPALTLNVRQAFGDTKALGEISTPYTIAISDTAAHVAANIDALNSDASVTSIALTDTGTPVLILGVPDALNDTTALDEISGPYTITISDSADDVAFSIDALNSDAHVTSITLTDVGTPALTLEVAQALGDTNALREISTPYTIAISDTAAHVAANIAALNSDAHVTAITLTNVGTPALKLNVAQALGDTTALDEIGTPYTVTISDTAAHVAANIAALNADTHVTSIAMTNTGTPALTLKVAQALGETTALGEIKTPYTIAISDTVPAVQDTLSQLAALGAKISAITTTGTGHVTVKASSFKTLETTLNKIASGFIVGDTAANIALDLSALDVDAAHIVSITATGGKVSVSTATFGADKSALNKIVGDFVVSDSAANVKAHLTALDGDVAHIAAVDLTGSGTHILSLSASQNTTDAALIKKIAAPYVLDVATSAGHTTTTGHGNGLKIADVKGTDLITGGGAGETFVLAAGFGHATIKDAHSHWTGATHDVIDFAKSEFANFAALLKDATFAASGTTITKGSDDLLIVGLTNKTQFTAADNLGDFKFV